MGYRVNKKAINLLVIIALPILIALYLYPLKDREIRSGREYQQAEFTIKDEDLFFKTPTFKNLIADIFSVPLSLDWYKVSIANNSNIKNPDCLINGITTNFFYFSEGDPRKYGTNLRETTKDTGGWIDNRGPGHPTYYVESGEKSFFIAPSWGNYSINGGLMLQGDCIKRLNDEFGLGESIYDYKISIKPYWVSWVVRLAILYVFWIFLLSSFITIRDWFRK